MSQLDVEVLPPARVVCRHTAQQVQGTGVEGQFGILPQHAPFVSELGVGILRVDGTDSGNLSYFVGGGYLEVVDNKVTVLADIIERAEDIDVGRAKSSRERARDRLDKLEAINVARAQASLARANARLSIAARG